MSTLQDYCDGDVFCSSSLYSVHPEGLQIFFYFDELEVCNPLGSKATTHKLGNALSFVDTVCMYSIYHHCGI